MASYIPGGGGQVAPVIQPQGGEGPGQLVQLAMAVKAFKIQQAQTEKSEAQQKIQMLLANPQLLLMTDHKDLEKAFKKGYDLTFTADSPMTPDKIRSTLNQAQPTGGTPASGGAIDPNSIAAVGNAVQGNKAGAQAGTPPSAGAANKAPGGGVSPSGSSPQLMEHLASEATQRMNAKYGAMAPLYGQAMTQIEQEQVKAQTMLEIENLKQAAAQGNLQAMGRLFQMSGKNVTDQDMRAMIISSGGYNSSNPEQNSKAFNDAMNFVLGNETGGDRAKRFDSTLKTLAGTPQVMEKFVNPLDVTEFARSVVDGGALPQGMNLKPLTLDELKAEADYEKYMTNEVGIPYDTAHLVARARSMGMDTNLALPKGFQSIVQRETKAKEVTAGAAATAAKADMIKARAEMDKIKDTIKLRVSDALQEKLRLMTEAAKAKQPWPQPVQDAILGQLATESGLMPEQTNDFFHFLTGGTHQTYTPNPDSELAKQAAGAAAAPKKAPAKRDKTVAEKGGVFPGVSDEPPMPYPGKYPTNNPANLVYDILFGSQASKEPK